MTNLKISQLPVVDTLTGEEIFPIVAEGTNKAVSSSKIKSFATDDMYDEFNDRIEGLTSTEQGHYTELSGRIESARQEATDNDNAVDTALRELIADEAASRQSDISNVYTTLNNMDSSIRNYYDPIVEQNTTDISELITKVTTLTDNTTASLNGLDTKIDTQIGSVQSTITDLYAKLATSQQVNKMTYAQLFQLYTDGQLVPNSLYGITDYICAYNHPSMGTDEGFELQQSADDVEVIVLKAIDTNRFDEEVFYIRKPGYVPIRKCLYTIDPEELLFTKGMTTYHPTGCVYYMEDMNKNSACYDFKHVKFRRWAIKDITANMTPNDGTGGKFGPYRVMISRTTSYNMSDGRQIIGSGEENEVNLIPAIFNGTYRGNSLIPDMASKTAFHEDYIRDNLKPYQNTTKNQNDKYLAWQTDMYAKKGISVATNTGYANKMGQCNVTVDSEDYMDRYTFDYNGTDASERMKYNSTTDYLIYNTRIKSNDYYGYKGLNDRFTVANFVMAFSDSVINSASTFVFDNEIYTYGKCANTILLRGYNPSYQSAQLGKCKFGYKHGMSGSLIIGRNWSWNNIGRLENSYINGTVSKIDAGTIKGCVMFGYYQGMRFTECTECLLFGSDANIKVDGASSYTDAPDGEYWYNSMWQDWMGYNILAPCQYCYFYPHFNCNTFRAYYNKGVIVESANQGNSYGQLVWGTRLKYGIGQGIKFGNLGRVEIRSRAFVDKVITNTTGIEIFPNSTTVPTLWNLNIESFNADPAKINEQSSQMLAELAKNTAHGGTIVTLTTMADGTWVVYTPFGTEFIAPATNSISTMSLVDEDNTIYNNEGINDFDDNSTFEQI